MSLTGVVFLVLVAVVALGAGVAAVVYLPRFAGGSVRAISGRIGVLLAVNVLVLFTVGVALNDQYYFFADWSDVRTAMFGGRAVHVSHAGGGAAQAANALLPGATPSGTLPASVVPTATATKPQPTLPPGVSIQGRTVHATITGSHSRLTGTVLITLPDDYNDPRSQDRSYPVLETFPGYPATPQQWPDGMNLTGELDRAVAQHTTGRVIVVSPQTEFPSGADDEC
ncbi:MAG: hypothetical protein JO147_02900, partial [Actinobacteria bacterium]|nr:hypothetical protein [Actinomycetota bacterium]